MSESLPPARSRSRISRHAPSVTQTTAVQEDAASESRRHLASFEIISDYDDLKIQILEVLHPKDVIERLWAEEVCILEWELQRLRNAKKSALDLAVAEVLEVRLRALPSENTMAAQMLPQWIPTAVEGYIRGIDEHVQHVHSLLGSRIGLELSGLAYMAQLGALSSLERLMHSCGQRRDTVLSRIYGRRELLAAS